MLAKAELWAIDKRPAMPLFQPWQRLRSPRKPCPQARPGQREACQALAEARLLGSFKALMSKKCFLFATALSLYVAMLHVCADVISHVLLAHCHQTLGSAAVAESRGAGLALVTS